MALTLEQYATAKKLDPALLSDCGISEQRMSEGTALRIPYTDEDGTLLATRYRFELHGRNRFRWQAGSRPRPYGLHRLDEARRHGFVLVTTSESDCQTLWGYELPAIGLPRSNFWREDRDANLLDGIAKIYVIHGTAGAPDWVQNSAVRARVHFVGLPDHAKDLNELYLAAPDGFLTAMQALMDHSTPWETLERRRAFRMERVLFGACGVLASSDQILVPFLKSVRDIGLVDEGRNAATIYLALTSRLLARPVSVAIKGPPASGKSFMVERVLAHFPNDAAIKATSMSEKALLFLNEDLRHKHIVIAESHGISSQFQDYLIRNLLSEGTLDYFKTEQGANGATTKRYVRQGPTGLIITTTQLSLHPDNETRLMTLEACSSAHWTRKAMQAMAARKECLPGVDPAWIALQAWLAAGERRVVVPYAAALASLIPANTVRIRRDFGHLLSLIEAHALLHRLSRERDDEGRIVATLRDYNLVRDMVERVLSNALGATVSDEMRQTVTVVRRLAHILDSSLKAIAENLGVDRSTASRRCKAALAAGYIVRQKVPRRNEFEYLPDCPLPEAGARLLPGTEEVEKAWNSLSGKDIGLPDQALLEPQPD